MARRDDAHDNDGDILPTTALLFPGVDGRKKIIKCGGYFHAELKVRA